MPVAQLTFLPISFISGVWFPLDDAPVVAGAPSRTSSRSTHLVDAFVACFVPGASVDGCSDLGSLAIWGAVGMFVAVRRLQVIDGAPGLSANSQLPLR